MLIALNSIVLVIMALGFGIYFSRLNWNFILRRVDRATNICLYVLLVIMGVSVGQVEGIFQKLTVVGLNALLVAIATSLGTAAMLGLLLLQRGGGVHHNRKEDDDSRLNRLLNYAKDPVQLLGLVGLGFLLSYFNFAPEFNYDALIGMLLYLLIFLIGVKLSRGSFRIVDILFDRRGLVIATLTVIGTYLGLLVLAWFMDMPATSMLVLGSGFGWYTLSGIMLTQLGDPLLGSTAFFADVFREILALLLIPILGRSGRTQIAIGVCGATCMDVTLPVIERHCAQDQVSTAFASGAIITFIVPFLIPASYFLR